MNNKKRVPMKKDPVSVAENMRLADNYHKNRLIDPLEAYRHYNQSMEKVHGCNKGKTPVYSYRTGNMIWIYL